jgi:RHS repeat-associated protein
VSTTLQYDTLNRLTSLGSQSPSGPVASYAYTLGAAGNRTGVTELSGRKVTYAYDNLYRLTSETITNSALSGAVGYQYDAVGNRKQRTSNLAAIPASGLLNYDANDRTTTDIYDNDGNTVGFAGIQSTYDYENHLASYGGITYVYDGDGNRVAKTIGGVTTNYLVDTLNPTGYAQVLDELQSGSVTRSYTWGLQQISESQPVQGAWTTSWYGFDGHGSVRYLTDATGAVTDRYDYDAFGNLINSTGSTPNNYLFAGEQFDPDTHLYYNRARYLDVRVGRFWGMDTDEGDDEEPLSLHKYLYGSANPANRIDPSGHDDIASLMTAAAVSVTLFAMSAAVSENMATDAQVELHFNQIPQYRKAHHIYILLKGPGRPTLQFRGGPSQTGGCGKLDVVLGLSRGMADTSSDCGYLTSAGSDEEFTSQATDYPSHPGDDDAKVQVPIIGGKKYDSIRNAFKRASVDVDDLGLPYDPIYNNSNAFAYTLILWAHLIPPSTPVSAPGWGHMLLGTP